MVLRNQFFSAVHYFHTLQEENFSLLQGVGVNLKKEFLITWALTHTMNAALDVLNEHFDYKVLFNHFPEWFRYGWSWSPYSLELNPCDYFLWGCVEDKIYNNPLATEKLWRNIATDS